MGRPIFPNTFYQNHLLPGIQQLPAQTPPAFCCLFLLKYCAGLSPRFNFLFEDEESFFFSDQPAARLHMTIASEALSSLLNTGEHIYCLLRRRGWGLLWTLRSTPPTTQGRPYRHILVCDPGIGPTSAEYDLIYFDAATRSAGYINANLLMHDIRSHLYPIIGCPQLRQRLAQ